MKNILKLKEKFKRAKEIRTEQLKWKARLFETTTYVNQRKLNFCSCSNETSVEKNRSKSWLIGRNSEGKKKKEKETKLNRKFTIRRKTN